MTPLEAAYLSAKDRLGGLDYEAFSGSVADWSVFPIEVESDVCGAILTKGPEVHVCLLPHASGRWFRKWHLDLLDAIVEKHGYARTSATTDQGRRFVQRLGFVQEGESWVLKQRS